MFAALPTHLRGSSRRLRTTMIALGLAVVAALAVTPAANAWTSDSRVQLTGHAVCLRHGDHPSSVFVLQYHPLRNGQFAYLDRFGRYSIELPAVPAGAGAGEFARVGCEGRGGPYSFDRNFPVARPRWGATVARDLIG